MSEQKTDREIVDLARRLASILDEPEEGLATWHIARARLGRELHDALGAALGEFRPAPIDWPARFRAAADAADHAGSPDVAYQLRCVAAATAWLPAHVVVAFGRALLGEAP